MLHGSTTFRECGMKNVFTDAEDISERGLISIRDMQDLSRRAVARCVIQTASRHAGYQCTFGTFDQHTKYWAEEARLARLTHEELVKITKEERFSRFRAVFEDDEKFATDNSILRMLWDNRQDEMKEYMTKEWIWQEDMLQRTAMQAGKPQDSDKDIIRQKAEEVKAFPIFSWIKPWTWWS